MIVQKLHSVYIEKGWPGPSVTHNSQQPDRNTQHHPGFFGKQFLQIAKSLMIVLAVEDSSAHIEQRPAAENNNSVAVL